MTKKITAMFIFEIMGRPAEHVKNTLNEFIDKLSKLPAVKINSRKIHEPKKIEKQGLQELYSTFAEVELIGDNIEVINDIVLNMLPSHIEVISPLELRFHNFELSSLLSKTAIKIHKYDEIAKASLMERQVLMKRIQEMQEKIKKLESDKKGKTAKKPVKKPVKKSMKKKTSKRK